MRGPQGQPADLERGEGSKGVREAGVKGALMLPRIAACATVSLMLLGCHQSECQGLAEGLTLTREDQQELSKLWKEARALLIAGRYQDYRKTVLPKWRTHGDKAVLYALEKLKGSKFPAHSHEPEEYQRDVGDLVRTLVEDIPGRSERPFLQELGGKDGNAYFRGALIAYLKYHVSYEMCESLMALTDDRRPAMRLGEESIGQVPRVRDCASSLVIHVLGLDKRFATGQDTHAERDKSIRAFELWWRANKEKVKAKLEEKGSTTRGLSEGDL